MDSYQRMLDFAESHRAGTHLRAVIINPLLEGLPRLPCLLASTCLTFDTIGYLLPQWKQLEAWHNKHLLDVIGPMLGRSSDGDSRRRLAFMMSSLRVPQSLAERFTINAEGFTFSGQMTANGPMLSMDSDYIHNVKKLINVLVSCVRSIRIGTSIARRSHRMEVGIYELNLGVLEIVRTNFTKSEHGLVKLDLERKGYAAMDFPSALRLFAPKMLDCTRSPFGPDRRTVAVIFSSAGAA